MSSLPKIILASTSPYRREVMNRLGVEFTTVDPSVIEQREEGEQPLAMALRLAQAKAAAVAAHEPDALVIGGDQVLDVAGRDYGKPLTVANAITQLTELSGQQGIFHCGTTVIFGTQNWNYSVPTEVQWRQLTSHEIATYVSHEPALNSAGAAQLEGLGITLVERLASEDPTAIMGIPLISLGAILREVGFALPRPNNS